MKRKVTILGAGLVGTILAILLKKKGYDVSIYERRQDMRINPMAAGRSINLAMSNRGWKALDLAGLRAEIEEIAIPMYGRFLHQKDGSSAFQAYGKNNEAIYSVSRGDLNKKLMDLAEGHGIEIHFGMKAIDIHVSTNRVTFENDSREHFTIEADLLFGADGAFSALRDAYTRIDRTNYSQYYVPSGYKELFIPPGENNTFLMEKNALHIWPRGDFMMIALPNPDGNFTCTLFFPFEGPHSFDAIKTDTEIEDFFKSNFSDAVPLMPSYIHDYKNNPTASLITVKISNWHYQNKSALIGDAAHAIVPFYGQGMNAGFEDCSVLWDLMELYHDDWDKILTEYESRRKPNGDAVAELALDNFIEMRDKVGDPQFLMRKKIEKELGRMYPEIFNSVYEMVSFSHTPYAFAYQCSIIQDQLLKKIQSSGDFFESIENEEYKQTLDVWMNEYKQEVKDIPQYL